ncbi:unnamed protein product [Toxocara canis]|uniref:Uncharacterized protein n=1 Tax=Toxocara canis TaxID=6265 RepID=A0A183UL45_TOXCA|nr:unnamed protein product [Toxocara canis]
MWGIWTRYPPLICGRPLAGGRQSLPPIHETLMPLRQTRPLPSLRDALSSGSAGQQPALMCGVASNLSPLVSSCSSSPIAATSTIHDSRTVSPRFMPLTTTSSLNGARLNAAASPTPQQPQHELGKASHAISDLIAVSLICGSFRSVDVI